MKTSPPKDLIEYLLDLISPPDEKAVFWSDLKQIQWDEIQDDSLYGLIARGTPTEYESQQIMRVLKPGAHLLLIAPDEEPTGHTGACTIEDTGFEIRDAILWIREPERFYYVPKTARKERELGCSHLKGKSGAEAVSRKEDTAGLNNPRAGAGRTASHVKNFHPTIKPIDLMRNLLNSVPIDGRPVLDPFLGSGSTALACLHTGHDCIGIEQDEDYLEIADARVRYWEGVTRNKRNWQSASIESDKDSTPKEEILGIFDLFYED